VTVTDPEHQEARRPRFAPIASLVGPLLIGVVFFCVLTPLAIVMRLAGGDPLRLRRDRAAPSYWIARPARGGRQTAMTRQS